MSAGILHHWKRVRDKRLRQQLNLKWQCARYGSYRQRRSYRPSCPQLVLPPPLASSTERRRSV